MTIIAGTIITDTNVETSIFKYDKDFTKKELVEECRSLMEDLYCGGEPEDLEDAEVVFKRNFAVISADLGNDFRINFTMQKF